MTLKPAFFREAHAFDTILMRMVPRTWRFGFKCRDRSVTVSTRISVDTDTGFPLFS